MERPEAEEASSGRRAQVARGRARAAALRRVRSQRASAVAELLRDSWRLQEQLQRLTPSVEALGLVAWPTLRQARPPQPGKRPGPGVPDGAPCLGIAYFASHAIFLFMGCGLSVLMAEDSEAIRRTSDSSDSCVLKNGHQSKAGPDDSSPEAAQSLQPPYSPQTSPAEPHQPVMPVT